MIFSLRVLQPGRPLHSLCIFFVGAITGAIAFPLTFIFFIPILPGFLFGFFLFWLSRYYGIRKRAGWWFLAGSVSHFITFAAIIIYAVGSSSRDYATIYSLAFASFAGGLVLLLFARGIIGYFHKKWSFVLLTIAIVVPSAGYLFVGGETYTVLDPMFGIPEPSIKYLLPVMMVWQGAVLLVFDFLFRKKSQNLSLEDQSALTRTTITEKKKNSTYIKKFFLLLAIGLVFIMCIVSGFFWMLIANGLIEV